jgi:hypothetical protein
MEDILLKYLGNDRGWSYKVANYNVKLTDQIYSVIKNAAERVFIYIKDSQRNNAGSETVYIPYNGVDTTYEDKSIDLIIEIRPDTNVTCFAYHDWRVNRIIIYPLYLVKRINAVAPYVLKNKNKMMYSIRGILEHEFVHFVDPRSYNENDNEMNRMWVPEGDNFETEIEFNGYCKDIIRNLKSWIGNDDKSDVRRYELICWVRANKLTEFPVPPNDSPEPHLKDFLQDKNEIFKIWQGNALFVRRFFLTVYAELFPNGPGISATAIVYMKRYSSRFESYNFLHIPFR